VVLKMDHLRISSL